MKIVSFYADVDGRDYFKAAALLLMEQCRNLGLDYDISEENFGPEWIDNERAKAKFLLRKFKELREPFIWLDCDCRILRPIDFTIQADWGVYLREDGAPHDFVHYIGDAPSNLHFLEQWVATIEAQERGSHTAFIGLFDGLKSEILPAGYFELGLSDSPSKLKYFRESES